MQNLADFGRIAVVMMWKTDEGRNYTNIGNLDTMCQYIANIANIANIADIVDIAKEASRQNFGCRKPLNVDL